ncbi:MAG: hypothetical protein DMF39_11580 [Verrucomicrobia bacterium]|nr:MAG: hypothetical protein DMF39_11580 [Verrucomicrobiota bacterium]
MTIPPILEIVLREQPSRTMFSRKNLGGGGCGLTGYECSQSATPTAGENFRRRKPELANPQSAI